MARRKLTEIVRYLQHVADSSEAGLSDAELVERYVRSRDEAAFELLLWRHGVLVFNVCRRLLSSEQDAEDAFQATFLAFVRKAHAISRRGSVSSWLYKVAYRIALEARERARKTSSRERLGGEALAVQPSSDPIWDDLRPVLDEELNRLPERLRRPFVLCYLEAKTNEEAARQLGCRPGTIFSRLARARELLRSRLLRRGVTLSAAALTTALTEHAAEGVPAAPLLKAALLYAGGQAAGSISMQITTLAEGALRTMFVSKLKMAALLLFVAGLLSAGSVLTHALTAAPQQETKAEKPAPRREEVRKPDAKPVAVGVVKPTLGGLVRKGVGPAEVIAAQQQRIVPLISGTVKEVGVDIGDSVRKGQVLIALDAPLIAKEVEQAAHAFEMAQAEEDEAKARILMAETEVESAKALRKVKLVEIDVAVADRDRLQSEVKRLEREVARNVIAGQVLTESQNKLELAKAKVKLAETAVASAEAEVKIKQGKLLHARAALKAAAAAARTAHAVMDKARIQESFTLLTAAFDGVVTQRTIDAGNFVQVSDSRLLTPLLTLQRTDQLRIVAKVSSEIAPFIGRGDPVDLDLGAKPPIHIPDQKIARFSPTLKGAQMTVEIDVSNADRRLMPGMACIATIRPKNRPTNTLIVPSSCLVNYAQRFVYLVRDGKAHRVPVEVSWDDNKNAEIFKGIKASDLVITNNLAELDDGTPVEVKKEP